MTPSPQTQASSRKDRALKIRGAICAALGITEMEHAEMQFENGIVYLETFFPGGLYNECDLKRARLYWSWWRSRWLERDEMFLAILDQGCPAGALPSPDQIRRMYRGFNNPAVLACEVSPPRVVYTASKTTVLC